MVLLSALAGLALLGLDILVTGRLSLLFDLGFVVTCIAVALAVRPRDFFTVGVLPPLLMLGAAVLLALWDVTAIADARDGVVQAVVSGLTHHAGALITGYMLTLAILAVRRRVITTRRRSGFRRRVAVLR